MVDVSSGEAPDSAAAPHSARKRKPVRLRFFDEILPTEHRAINARRARHGRFKVRLLKPGRAEGGEKSKGEGRYTRSTGGSEAPTVTPTPSGRPDSPVVERRPTPYDCVGLALSGGGIRSASFCMGALQALNSHEALGSIDYVSTVSGGGYIGSCMTAGMSKGAHQFPFGGAGDISDTASVGHVRNYSNYLMPRGRSSITNGAEALLIILRGMLANAVIILAALFGLALLTAAAYPAHDHLLKGSYLPRLIDAGLGWFRRDASINVRVGDHPFALTLTMTGALIVLLLWWVILRSVIRRNANDVGSLLVVAVLAYTVPMFLIPLAFAVVQGTAGSFIAGFLGTGERPLEPQLFGLLGFAALAAFAMTYLHGSKDDVHGPTLAIVRWFSILSLVIAFLDLQPVLIHWLALLYADETQIGSRTSAFLNTAGAVLSGAAGAVAFASSKLGSFLKATQHSTGTGTIVLRVLTRILVYAASLVFPLLLVIAYLHLSAWVIEGAQAVPSPFAGAALPTIWKIYLCAFAGLLAAAITFKPNAYSLHQFYRSRLSAAFIFAQDSPALFPPKGIRPLDGFKLSQIDETSCPYPIINAALNVQGSAEANRRGRDADFFMFTRDYIGSDLTLFAGTLEREAAFADTRDMESIDPRLDLAAAMAISGAAISANMGTNTVRTLSPTLALLNIRLGYWLRNPRSLARPRRAHHLLQWINFDRVLVKFYLLLEMFNLLDEKRRLIYLTDGGHIENLGIYELLKRGCQLVIAVDAEADPAMAFPSLLKLERYARIDLGVRIELPWQEIAAATKAVSKSLETDWALTDKATARTTPFLSHFVSSGRPAAQDWVGPKPYEATGPHCAVGRITYPDGAEGVLLYIKASLTGGEKDYILDYKKRNSSFPHETTGDQFFSEEQLEVYRALGFHAVHGLFSGMHEFAWSPQVWNDADHALQEIRALMPTLVV